MPLDDGPPSPPPGGRQKRGFRPQLGATIAAARTLVQAHVELAKAELSEIMEHVQRVAALFGAAIGLVLYAASLVVIGTSLFLGEWLFGSIGWGVLLFTELALSVALAAVLLAIDVPPGRLTGALVRATILGVVVAIVAGLFLFNRLWTEVGTRLLPGVDPGNVALVAGLLVGALVGAIVGLVFGVQTSGGGTVGQTLGRAVAGALGGALLGAAVGAFTAITFSWQVAVALGIATLLATWAALCAREARRADLDMEAWGRRFYPSVTIDTAKETMEWVRERMPLGPKS
jgi:MFS family permease